MPEPWIVLLIYDQLDDKVEAWLKACAVETYFPVVRELKRLRGGKRNGQTIEIKRPLFPGYAFASVDAAPHTESCPYNFRVLQFGGEVAIIQEDAINHLKARTERDGAIRLAREPRTEREFKRKQRLRVTSGPFTGFDCLCDGMDGDARVKILLSIFGAKRQIVLAADSLTAA